MKIFVFIIFFYFRDPTKRLMITRCDVRAQNYWHRRRRNNRRVFSEIYVNPVRAIRVFRYETVVQTKRTNNVRVVVSSVVVVTCVVRTAVLFNRKSHERRLRTRIASRGRRVTDTSTPLDFLIRRRVGRLGFRSKIPRAAVPTEIHAPYRRFPVQKVRYML